MKTFKMLVFAAAALLGTAIASCSDANEYEDYDSSNPSWIEGTWNDSTAVAHPESLQGTTWSRTSGLKLNAYGEDVQGFVESIEFTDPDSCIVKMSQPVFPASWSGNTTITWTDESNTPKLPKYEYKYTDATGVIEILKLTVNDKGAVSKKAIFTGLAVQGTKNVITIAHFGDVPTHSYLLKK